MNYIYMSEGCKGFCYRISCCWDTGIYLCNDKDDAQYIHARYLGFLLQFLRDRGCPSGDKHQEQPWSQVYHKLWMFWLSICATTVWDGLC